MKAGRKWVILVVAVLGFGAVRLPFEKSLHRELLDVGLLTEPLDIGTRDRIGQTSSAVALGGLRTLVATFLNLRAFGYFTVQKWMDLEETFEMIVDLAPRTRYYWETGSWHLAYNAASYYINDSELPALRRREEWRRSILKGRAFLERGVKNNPDDWSIAANLGFLLSDTYKFQAFRDPDESFAAAAEAYQRAWNTGNALGYVERSAFYALSRVRGREAEALEMGRQLYAAREKNRTPTLLSMIFVLESYVDPPKDPVARAVELFGSEEKAYQVLSGHWFRTRERFPVYGVAGVVKSLESKLGIPEKDSVLNRPLPTPRSLDEMFRDD